MFKKIRNKITSAAVAVQTAIANKKAEGYVDSGVKILIAVVVGSVFLSLLYLLFNGTIMPNVSSRIQSLFNYAGT